MHILFVSPHCDPEANLGEPDSGGQCVYQHELALALAEKGVKVTTFCRQTGKRLDVSDVHKNYTIQRIITGEKNFVPKEAIESHMPAFVKGMHELVDKVHTDPAEPLVIHGHYWDGAKIALMYKHNFTNIPFIWTPHSLGSVKRQKFPGKEAEHEYHFLPRLIWENYATYAADSIIVSTQDERQKLLESYSVVGNPTVVIPPGIDLSGFAVKSKNELRQKHGLPNPQLLLLCLGRLSRNKGYHHAVHILHKLRTEQQLDAQLVIVGGSVERTGVEEKMYSQEITDLIKSLHMEAYVTMKPAVSHDQVGEIFGATDVFLMTSENEPYGLTTVEAMASQAAVIAHNKGGTKDIIKQDQTGLLVNIHQYSTVAQEIMIRHTSDTLKQLGVAARQDILAHFSWQQRADNFINIYKQVAQYQKKSFKTFTENNYFLETNLEV